METFKNFYLNNDGKWSMQSDNSKTIKTFLYVNKRLIGYGILSTAFDPKYDWLQSVHINSKYRNRGYGSKIIKKLLKLSKRSVMVRVEPFEKSTGPLFDDEKTEILIKYYTRFGFKSIDPTRPQYMIFEKWMVASPGLSPRP